MKQKLLLSMAGLLLIGGMSSVEARVNMKLSHNHGRNHPVHKAMQYFSDRVKTLTEGEVVIRLYPDAQLGTQRESLEQVQTGAIEMAKSNASELEAFHKPYGVYGYPYIFKDRDHYYEVMMGDIGQSILKSSKDKGFIGIAYYDAGARSFYAKKPITTPDDLKGLKVRVQPSPTAIEMTKYLGANPIPISYGELYTALQQGVVDAAENNMTALTLSRHGEVAKYFSLDEHTMVPDVLVISSIAWDKLTKEQQAAIEQAALESTLYMKELWSQAEEKELAEIEKLNVSIVAVDKLPFQKAVQPMFDQLKVDDPETFEVIENIQLLAD